MQSLKVTSEQRAFAIVALKSGAVPQSKLGTLLVINF